MITTYNTSTEVSYQELVNELPIRKLTNTDEDTFLYTSKKFETRFRNEDASAGQTFVDGNNGDRWIVISSNKKEMKKRGFECGALRMIVRNTSQDLSPVLMYW